MCEDTNTYGVTFLETPGVFTIFSDDTCNMSWNEAVENLQWLVDNESGFS